MVYQILLRLVIKKWPRQKAVSDAMSKQMDLANKARAEENKKELEKRKIAAQEKADKLKATIEKKR